MSGRSPPAAPGAPYRTARPVAGAVTEGRIEDVREVPLSESSGMAVARCLSSAMARSPETSTLAPAVTSMTWRYSSAAR